MIGPMQSARNSLRNSQKAVFLYTKSKYGHLKYILFLCLLFLHFSLLPRISFFEF